MWGHRRYQGSSSPSFTPLPPPAASLSHEILRSYTSTADRSPVSHQPFFPVHLASSARVVFFLSLSPSLPPSLAYPTGIATYHLLHLVPPRALVCVSCVSSAARSDKKAEEGVGRARWWKDLGLVCHHRLTRGWGGVGSGRGERGGTRWSPQDLLDLSRRRIKTRCCLPRGQFSTRKPIKSVDSPKRFRVRRAASTARPPLSSHESQPPPPPPLPLSSPAAAAARRSDL